MQPRPTPGIGVCSLDDNGKPTSSDSSLLRFRLGHGDMLKAYNYCFSHGLVYGGACGETRWKMSMKNSYAPSDWTTSSSTPVLLSPHFGSTRCVRLVSGEDDGVDDDEKMTR